jgi:hypothetical protein
MIIFWGYSCFFQKPYIFKSWGFCVAFSASGGFFWAIKNSFLTIFPIFHHKGGHLWFRTSKKTYDTPKNGRKLKTKVFLWTELQMDQEFRWYSMFERLNQNFMKIRISLPSRWDCPHCPLRLAPPLLRVTRPWPWTRGKQVRSIGHLEGGRVREEYNQWMQIRDC